jgi:integrase
VSRQPDNRYNAGMNSSLALAPLPSERLDSMPPGLTVEDARRIAATLTAAHTESTRRIYGYLWGAWERWCTHRGVAALPADPAVLAGYLVERAAAGIAPVSLDVACVAIRYVHRTHGHPNPCDEELVRQVRQGLRRIYGTAPRRQARPLTVLEIRQIVSAIDRSTPIGARNAAMILLGHASAMRGSELVGLDLADVETKPAGLLFTIRSSKTDQEHRGQTVAVAHGSNAVTDPVAALNAWVKIRGDHPGALFTRIWDSRISDQRLGGWVVARMLREQAVAAGLDGTRITAHSLRAGHATAAAMAGVPLTRIAAQTPPQGPRRPGQSLHPTPRSPRHHLQPRPRPLTRTWEAASQLRRSWARTSQASGLDPVPRQHG